MPLSKIIAIFFFILSTISCQNIPHPTKHETNKRIYSFRLLEVIEEKNTAINDKILHRQGNIILVDKEDPAIKYILKNKAILDNSTIIRAEISSDNFRHTHTINLHFSKKGTQILSDYTARHIGKKLALVINNKVYSAPTILEKIDQGIVQISAYFTLEKAFEIANAINKNKKARN